MRTGLVFRKVGMTRLFASNGSHVPVTMLELLSSDVVAVKNKEKHGYNAVQISAGKKGKAKNVSKSVKGHFAKAGVEPTPKLIEFRVSEDALLNVGDVIDVNHFVEGQYVDASSVSIGKGFAGVMKRHNFGGLEASHGVSVSHRSHGSTGQRQDPGKVFKGKKMAGHMGCRKVTVQNLEVKKILSEDNVILIHGAVPGAKNSYITITDAIKKPLPASAKYPALLAGKNDDGKSVVNVVEDSAGTKDSGAELTAV